MVPEWDLAGEIDRNIQTICSRLQMVGNLPKALRHLKAAILRKNLPRRRVKRLLKDLTLRKVATVLKCRKETDPVMQGETIWAYKR